MSKFKCLNFQDENLSLFTLFNLHGQYAPNKGQKTQQMKHCQNNNKDDDNSLNANSANKMKSHPWNRIILISPVSQMKGQVPLRQLFAMKNHFVEQTPCVDTFLNIIILTTPSINHHLSTLSSLAVPSFILYITNFYDNHFECNLT